MATRLRIASWKAQGFRCPDHTIDLLTAQQEVHPITLIQMPNGTGKTTTLELLRAALSGSAREWDENRIQTFRKLDPASERGEFQVVLLHNEKGRITITMEFDFETFQVHYSTTLKSGNKNGFHPPRDVQRFLRSDFVNFFVFDGELAEHLLDRDKTDAQTAIEDLFQLKTLSKLALRVNDYWQAVTAKRGAKEDRGLARRRNRVTELEAQLKRAKAEYGTLAKQEEALGRALKDKRQRFDARIREKQEDRARIQAAEKALATAVEEGNACVRTALATMRDPHALSQTFAHQVTTFKSSLDKAKLPESAAREFFEELAEEAQCVCGRELDEGTRENIRNRSQTYLGSDDVALLNALKSDIADQVGRDVARHEAKLREDLQGVVKAIKEVGRRRTDRDAIVEATVAQDSELENAQAEITKLSNQIDTVRGKLQKYKDASERAGDRDTWGIEVLERRLQDAEKKLAEVTETLELKAKQEVLARILERARDLARTRISAHICNEANERISELMPDNNIRIERIDRSLELHRQEGGSVGETLCVGYAFLATLFNRTEHQLPFVADSPANPIDLKRRKSVAELIPKLGEQFVAFTISSEREGFLNALHRAAEGQVQYLTLFRKSAGEPMRQAKRSKAQREETKDGMLMYGEEFFKSFQLDKE